MAGAIYSQAQEAIAKAFAQLRREAGFKQAELAAGIGKHQSYISDVERGQRRLDVLEALVIAKVLGFEPTDFYARLVQDVPSDASLS